MIGPFRIGIVKLDIDLTTEPGATLVVGAKGVVSNEKKTRVKVANDTALTTVRHRSPAPFGDSH